MKKLTLLLLFFTSLLGFSQNKDAINYQSVIRNSSGIIVNQLVNIKLSILEATANGDVVYSETHLVTSNDYGIISLQIGNGSTETGDYNAINWGSANHFLKIEIDETGGNDFVFMGTNQFLSVPYALSAKTAEDVDDADADSQNEIQTLERTDNTLTLSKSGGSVSIADNDNDSLNEIQTLELVGNQLKISDGNSVIITGTIDLDADPTNEFQSLTLKGDSILIANGTGIELPPTGDVDSTNEFQNLSLKDDSVLISNGVGIQLPSAGDLDSTNEFQNLTLVNDSILISNGEGIALNDNDSLNEIQMLSISNDTVFLENGGFVKLPTYIDNDTTNEIQHLTISKDSILLTNSSGISINEIIKNSNETNGVFNLNSYDQKCQTLFKMSPIDGIRNTWELTEQYQESSIDSVGNIIHAISLNDSITINGAKYTPGGSNDILICKYSPIGQLIWTKQFNNDLSLSVFKLKSVNDKTYVLLKSFGTGSFEGISVSLKTIFVCLNSEGQIIYSKFYPHYDADEINFDVDENETVYILRKNVYVNYDVAYEILTSDGSLINSGSLTNPGNTGQIGDVKYYNGEVYCSIGGYNAELHKLNVVNQTTGLIKYKSNGYLPDYEGGLLEINSNGILWHFIEKKYVEEEFLFLDHSDYSTIWNLQSNNSEHLKSLVSYDDNSFIISPGTKISEGYLDQIYLAKAKSISVIIDTDGIINETFSKEVIAGLYGFEVLVNKGKIGYVFRAEGPFMNNSQLFEKGVYYISECE